jgi:ClpP class serine protease
MWLIDQKAYEILDFAKKNYKISSDLQDNFEKTISLSSKEIDYVVNNEANIHVKGVITKEPNIIASLFGGGNVTYPDIIKAVNAADKDDSIESINLYIDSPGGHFDGLFDALEAIRKTKKPVKAIIHNLGASAAYAIASQADEIVAYNHAARVGSIGVALTVGVQDNEFTFTSTNAPRKRPDVKTEDGKKTIIDELDALHEIFVDAIAEGRGISSGKINAEFGKGAILLAEEALKRGMIDKIQNTSSNDYKRSFNKNKQPEIRKMDLETMKTEHSALFAQVVQIGVQQERDRVCAHLTMGGASGDMDTAVSAIKDGSDMTASLQATYLAAGMNKRDLSNREDDDKQAACASSAPNESIETLYEKVCANVEASLGAFGE